MTTRQDIRNEGFRRGQSIASITNLPAIGEPIPPLVDAVEMEDLGKHVTEDNRYNYWMRLCWADDWGDPDKYDAMGKPYDAWNVFCEGVEAGIRAYGRRHHAAALAAATTQPR